jgi:Uma2 family endonuclease
MHSMSRLSTIKRRLVPGTTGWTADDLDDPRIAAQWEAGRFQIFEGVLAIVPPAYFDTSTPLTRLIVAVQLYLKDAGHNEAFATEVDLELNDIRIPRADAVYLSAQDKAKQAARRRPRTPKQLKYGRLRVPPTLVIENISRGHESEDRVVKRAYYEQAGIPNYWILDAYQKSLECLRLDAGRYVIDQIGRGTASVSPSCFPGLTIELGELWEF